MNWVHLIFGLVLFLVFIMSGTFMRADYPDKDAIPQELRLLMRSRHIYILFSSLIHLALGAYLQLGSKTGPRILQFAGSVMLIFSSFILISAFGVESYSLQRFSDISRYGIYASLGGVVLHVLGGIAIRRT
jgi:hypothetical protein